MSSVEGGCLCGAIRYSSSAEPRGMFVCHCTDCQRQTGTAFSVIVSVPETSFTIAGESLSSFDTDGDDSGQPVHRYFCSSCGSPLFSKVEAFTESVFIKAGTLDDSSWLDPKYHIWTSSKQPWVHIDESAATSARS
ncbi:MAG: GFA family protein [Actinomycetia bacterium]|nr:GFA family protein [Actinomycetes bacterium]MCP4962328.1 GFA family protein [Actinomycetes bacterium]